jgi:2-isopropylmalate synthase
MARTSRAIGEIANIGPDPHQPWVGRSAFAHKAGLHVSAVEADPMLYQHVEPLAVGNGTRLVMSELGGRATVRAMARAIGLEPDDDVAARVTARVKELEAAGYSFEAAEGSVELLLLEQMDMRPRLFTLQSWHVTNRTDCHKILWQAHVSCLAGGDTHESDASGDGPVDALHCALRQVVMQLMPALSALRLADYKVRVVNGHEGARAVVRVLVTTTDGASRWTTVAAGTDLVAASLNALIDAFDLGVRRHAGHPAWTSASERDACVPTRTAAAPSSASSGASV